MRTFAKARRGSALILALVVTIIGAGMAATALTISAYQSKTTSRESTRERALTVAESGLDDVIYRLNSYTGFGTVSLSTVTGTIGRDTYTVTITPTFVGGGGTYTLRASSTRDHEKRGIQAIVTPTMATMFDYGLFADGFYTQSGASVSDSYRSSLGTYASQATNYDAVHGEYYARTNGHIGANGSITVSGQVANYGNANPGPGQTYSSSGGAYTSGSTTPASTATVLPPLLPYLPPIVSSGDFQPASDTTLNSGTYRFNKITLSGSTDLIFNGNVTIYVDGDVSISGQSTLNMLANSKVKIIQGAGSFTLSGGGLVNTSQTPNNFSLVSHSTASVTFSGGTNFYGTVYAPKAQFSASGNVEYYGAFVAKTMNISGGARFHRDEDVLNDAVPGTYRIRSWIEYIP
jgi:hypothetical protein